MSESYTKLMYRVETHDAEDDEQTPCLIARRFPCNRVTHGWYSTAREAVEVKMRELTADYEKAAAPLRDLLVSIK